MSDRKSDAARYSKVTRRIWLDAGFRELSAPPPNGRDCWMRLLTAPEQGPIPGLFQAWPAGIAQSLGWSPEGFTEAFGEVFAKGMAKVDERVGLFFLPNAIKHNEPESPNVVRGWKRHWAELPDSQLKDEAARVLREHMRARGESWERAFSEAIGELPPSPSSNPSGRGKPKAKGRPKPSPKASVGSSPAPSPNQEPEQEQDHDLLPEHEQPSSRVVRPKENPLTRADLKQFEMETMGEMPPRFADVAISDWLTKPAPDSKKLFPHEWHAYAITVVRSAWRNKRKRDEIMSAIGASDDAAAPPEAVVTP